MKHFLTIAVSVVTLFSFSAFSAPPAPKLGDVIECYEGLRPSLGLKRMHFGKGPSIFAAGTRGGAQGVYTFEAGKLFFHTLPTTNTVDEMKEYGKSIERYAQGSKKNYYLTFESGGKTTHIVLGKSAERPLFWRAEGEWPNFVDTPGGIEIPGPGGLPTTVRNPVHVVPKPKAEVKVDDADAVAAYVASLGGFLSEPPNRLFKQKDLPAAIARCLASFPKGTTIGDALQPGTVEIAVGGTDRAGAMAKAASRPRATHAR